MEKLFGTDGIRGIANRHPITSEIALSIGQALAHVLKHDGHRPKIVIGKDTRLSGYMLESSLAGGICSMGADVILVGPMPTPGIAFITNNMDADAGVVISASHNPYYDNGIKIFSNSGYKLNNSQEEAIEKLVSSGELNSMLPLSKMIGRAYREADALGRYIVFLRHALHKRINLDDMKIALDCANGATYKIAPTLFREMRAEVFPINIHPDGKNINENSGAMHPEVIAEHVKNTGSDIGLAFDGDGDRLIASDEKGNIITGDTIIAIIAKHLKETGQLKNDLVITTVMSNIGLLKAFEKMGVKRIEAPVGDRFVLEKMIEHNAVLGGEDSGHIILHDHHTTGDGILTALQLLAVMQNSDLPLSELAEIMEKYPQYIKNIEVKEKKDIDTIPALKTAIEKAESKLKDSGRVLVRYSGTQALLRVMAEGPTEELTKSVVEDISAVAAKELS